MPSPPPRHTAAASSPPAAPAIGAHTTGTSSPNRSDSQVRIIGVLPAAAFINIIHNTPSRLGPNWLPAWAEGRRCAGSLDRSGG
jgi:hypothetical protein